ncbi:MAG: hypothetical protein AVDCRST_MAG57-1332 [uncultured Blastococcus sp.]|uniref:DUF2382 domain-containing protein n=1 Tax=uncultured Blastococcus sp. TaxID=217144 RepID=A0A6J4I0Y6_9ACTN|nr:MAG: hypothetical protein AVDCRST_MAG57-1332 [uncultured Blastococcus sp.]
MAVDPDPAAAEVVLHQEQLRVGTRRVPTEKVLVRRRIVTEVRQIEVTVRREEVEVHRVPLDGHEQSPVGGPPEPLVILLSEEVPVVQLQTRPYERVTVRVDTATEQVEVTEHLAREQAEVRSLDPARRPT